MLYDTILSNFVVVKKQIDIIYSCYNLFIYI